MATEYKLSYTANEIDEKLANVDVLESRIETLEENGNGNGNGGDFTSLDLTSDILLSELANDKYIAINSGNLVSSLGKQIEVKENSLVIKGDDSLTVYDNEDVKKISNFGREGVVHSVLAAQTFNVLDNILTINDNATGTISFAKQYATWGVIGIDKKTITIELRVSSRGLLIFKQSDSTYTLIQLLPANTTNIGAKGILNRPLNNSSQDVVWTKNYYEIPDAWKNATESTVFRIEKNNSNLKIYTANAESYELIFETNECNMIGFLDTNSNFSRLISGTVTTPKELSVHSAFNNTNTETVTSGLTTRFKNYNVLCIGDSITEKNFRADTNWVDYIDEWIGFKSIYNDGKSGTGIVRPYETTFKNWYDRIDDYTDSYDLILIMGNMNDYSGHVFDTTSLGVFGDATFDTQYGALKLYLEKLIAKYPLAKIGWITSIPRQYSGWEDGTLYGKNSLFEGATTAIKDVCGHYGIPVLDLFHESNLMPWISEHNEKYFKATSQASGDGVHPNSEGQKVVAYKIYDFVIKNF